VNAGPRETGGPLSLAHTEFIPEIASGLMRVTFHAPLASFS
jgi:hypothetical protein